MRILLITTIFQPYNSLGALRIGKLAKYLLSHGHQARVLAAKDVPMLPSLPVEISEEYVTYTKWFDINFLPEMMFGGKKKVAQSGYVTKSSKIKRLGDYYRYLLHLPDNFIGWLPYACSSGKNVIREYHPDLIYASGGPYTSLIVASWLSQWARIPWICELRDLWSDNPFYPFPGWRRGLDAWLERNALKSASGFVTVSNSMADSLGRKYGKPVKVILNGFDPDDFPAATEFSSVSKDILRIVYTGAVYPKFRDPSPLFAALARMGENNAHIRVVFYTRYTDVIDSLADQYGVSHLIEKNGLVPYREALKAQVEADILLMLLWNDPKEHGVMTGKLFEYLGARRPILALGPGHDQAAALIRDRKAGFISNNPDEIAKRVLEWREQKLSNGFMPSLPNSVNQGLSREEQFARLEDFLMSQLSYRHA